MNQGILKLRCLSFIFMIILLAQTSFGQMTMHDFTVTDSQGNTHNLYTTYLDQGKTVVIKFFFTTCPPCIAISPQFQAKYEEWGSGDHDVEFIEATTITSDNNTRVNAFKANYGLTMIGISHEGNAPAIVSPFKTGTYGSWYGTPTFAVIAPDRTLTYPLFFSELDDAIAATGAEKPGGNAPDPTTVQLNIQSQNLNIPDGHVKFFLKPKNASTPKIEITKNNQNQYIFDYPSVTFPQMEEPVIIMESNAPGYTNAITALDALDVQKHILDLKPFTSNRQFAGGDVNGDSLVTAFDALQIKKIILGTITQFPNTSSYKCLSCNQVLTSNPGNTVEVNIEVVKTGNVN
jgi:thiol-disulfide isomerase/thioredoxin